MRKKRSSARVTVPDPKYKEVLVAQFINCVMKRGKKHLARRIIYDSFSLIEERTKTPGVEVFKKAVSNARPILEVRARRVGGATYQVPTEVRPARSLALAMRWLIGEKRYHGLILAVAALKKALGFQRVQVEAIKERELALLRSAVACQKNGAACLSHHALAVR